MSNNDSGNLSGIRAVLAQLQALALQHRIEIDNLAGRVRSLSNKWWRWVALVALAAALVALVISLVGGGSAGTGGSAGAESRDSALWIAQITDPHVFEEARNDRPWAANEVEDRQAFADALEYLASTPMPSGRPADALVITGDFGLDTTFRARPPGTPRITDEEQVETVARLLGASQVKKVFVVVGNNDLTREEPTPATLALFNGFFSKVSARLQGSGVTVRNLTACYAGQPDSTCVADLPNRVRLVGFATGSFKNSPKPPSLPPATTTPATTSPSPTTPAQPTLTTPAGSTGTSTTTIPTTTTPAGSNPAPSTTTPTPPAPDTARPVAYDVKARAAVALRNRSGDSVAVARLAGLVAGAAGAGRYAVVLTHEPDLDDPFGVSEIARYRRTNAADTARLDAAIWNVDPAVRAEWKRTVERPPVIAVIAGHLHSSNRGDYVRPYLGSSAANRADFSRLFVGPPLAVKNQNDEYPQARGISLFRIAGDTVTRSIVWRDKVTGAFAAAAEGVDAPTVRPGGIDRVDRAIIALLALAAGVAGAFVGFAQGLGRWRKQVSAPVQTTDYRWLEHAGALPVLLFVLGGLALCLLLFCRTWDDRVVVAIWYVPFAVAGVVLGALLLRVKWIKG
jgi:3',5'-cyclic AMP phosphodiesterase CpdA